MEKRQAEDVVNAGIQVFSTYYIRSDYIVYASMTINLSGLA